MNVDSIGRFESASAVASDLEPGASGSGFERLLRSEIGGASPDRDRRAEPDRDARRSTSRSGEEPGRSQTADTSRSGAEPGSEGIAYQPEPASSGREEPDARRTAAGAGESGETRESASSRSDETGRERAEVDRTLENGEEVAEEAVLMIAQGAATRVSAEPASAPANGSAAGSAVIVEAAASTASTDPASPSATGASAPEIPPASSDGASASGESRPESRVGSGAERAAGESPAGASGSGAELARARAEGPSSDSSLREETGAPRAVEAAASSQGGDPARAAALAPGGADPGRTARTEIVAGPGSERADGATDPRGAGSGSQAALAGGREEGAADREGGRQETSSDRRSETDSRAGAAAAAASGSADSVARPEVGLPAGMAAEVADASSTRIDSATTSTASTTAIASSAATAPGAAMVAGAETAPAGSAPAPPAADALAVQTEWLAARGGGSARLVLHPPELGEIAIRVTLRGESVDVVMVAQEAAARTIAEEQSDRLAQAFSARDLRMESFEVRRADAQPALDPELESRLMDSGSREREQAGGEGAEEGDLRRPVGLRSGAGAASAMTSPGVAAPRTGSVDLRI